MDKTVFFRTIFDSGRVSKWKLARKLDLQLALETMEAEMKEALRMGNLVLAREIAEQGLGRKIAKEEIIAAANANQDLPRSAASIFQLLPPKLHQKEWERWLNTHIEQGIQKGYPDLNCVDLLPWFERESTYERMLKGVIENCMAGCLEIAEKIAALLKRDFTKDELLGLAIRSRKNGKWFDVRKIALLLPEPERSEWLEEAIRGLIHDILEGRYNIDYIDCLLGVEKEEKFYRDLREEEKQGLFSFAIRKKYWRQVINLALRFSSAEEKATAIRQIIPLYLEDDNQWPQYEIRYRSQNLIDMLPFISPEERIQAVRSFIFVTLTRGASERIECHRKLLQTIEEPNRTDLVQEIFLHCLNEGCSRGDLRDSVDLFSEPDKQELLDLLSY